MHGDTCANLLFDSVLPPAVIDFSPYWRPTAYADAIVAVDGLLWFRAGPDLVALASTGADFPQMLVRALLFRLLLETSLLALTPDMPDRPGTWTAKQG